MKLMLLSPDAADGGATGTEVIGASAEAEATGVAAGEAALDDVVEGAGEAAAAETAVDKTTGLTKEDISEILKSAGIGERQAPAAAAVERREPPSTDELEKMFNVWKPSAELLAQLRSEKPEEALAALAAIRDGMIKQTMTMAEYRVQQLLEKLTNDTITPLQSYVSEAQASSFRNDFFEKYPDLTKYEALVDAVAAKLQQANFKGESREAVMKKFADETQAVVKTLLAAGGTGVAADGDKNKGTAGATAGRKMSTLTGGGHGTGGGSRGGGEKPASGMEVFD